MIVSCEPYKSNFPRRSAAAWCAWHRQFFREFPRNCPAATPDPLATLDAMQALGWTDKPLSDIGLTVLDQVEVCGRCMERGLSHPAISGLRRRAGLAE